MDGLTQYLAMENGALTRKCDAMLVEKTEVQRRYGLAQELIGRQTLLLNGANAQIQDLEARNFNLEEVLIAQDVEKHETNELIYAMRLEMKRMKKEKRAMVEEINELNMWKEQASKKMKKMESQLLDKED